MNHTVYGVAANNVMNIRRLKSDFESENVCILAFYSEFVFITLAYKMSSNQILVWQKCDWKVKTPF